MSLERNGRNMSSNDWEADDWDETDWPDEQDEESLTIPCPACRADVYEDAEQCPYCGEYIVGTSMVWDARPAWWIILGGLGILATILALAL